MSQAVVPLALATRTVSFTASSLIATVSAIPSACRRMTSVAAANPHAAAGQTDSCQLPFSPLWPWGEHVFSVYRCRKPSIQVNNQTEAPTRKAPCTTFQERSWSASMSGPAHPALIAQQHTGCCFEVFGTS